MSIERKLQQKLYWRQRLGLLVSGALASLAFAPLSWWFLMPAALVYVFYTLHRAGSRRMAMGTIFYFCLGLYSVGIHWVYISIHYFGDTPLYLSIIANAILVLYLAGLMSLAGILLGRAHRLNGFSWLLYTSSCWMLAEWLRAVLLTGFPWLSLGISQIQSPLVGYFPIIGATATGFLLLLAASGIALSMVQSHNSKRWFWLSLPLLIYGIGLLTQPLDWTTKLPETKRVSLVQGNVPQSLKFNPETVYNDLESYIAASADALIEKPDVIIWPETSLIAELNLRAEILQTQLETVSIYNTDMIFGSFWGVDIGHGTEPPVFAAANAMVHISPKSTPIDDPQQSTERYVLQYAPDGSIVKRGSAYLKTHLLPFAETVPMSKITLPLYKLVSNLDIYPMQPGEWTQPLFVIDEMKIAPYICFESVFGSEIIDTAREANLLLNASNDTWFRNSIALDQHLEINLARAIENRRWLVRATNSGETVIADHLGKIRARLPRRYQDHELGRAEILTDNVELREGMTPYQRLGDGFWQIFWIIIAFIGMLATLDRRHQVMQNGKTI